MSHLWHSHAGVLPVMPQMWPLVQTVSSVQPAFVFDAVNRVPHEFVVVSVLSDAVPFWQTCVTTIDEVLFPSYARVS